MSAQRYAIVASVRTCAPAPWLCICTEAGRASLHRAFAVRHGTEHFVTLRSRSALRPNPEDRIGITCAAVFVVLESPRNEKTAICQWR